MSKSVKNLNATQTKKQLTKLYKDGVINAYIYEYLIMRINNHEKNKKIACKLS